MSPPPLGVLPPASLDHALSPLTDLKDDQFETLRSAINGSDGFDISKARCRQLAPSVGLQWQALAYALGAANYLYNRLKLFGAAESADQLRSYVDAIEKDIIPPEKRDVLLRRLTVLVQQNDTIDESKKLAGLRLGFLPNLKSIKSFVDVRANFTQKYSSVRNFVPIIQFRLATDADDPALRQYVFQVDERRLQSFKKAIVDVENKLNTLASSDLIKGLERRTDTDDEDE